MRIICILLFALAVLSAKAKAEYEYRVWFDRDIENNVASGPLGQSPLNIDISGLPHGLHVLNLQLLDGNNDVKGIRSGIFYYPAPEAVSEPQTIRYWFDRGGEVSAIPFEQARGGTLIDTSTLTHGLHVLNLQLLDGNNVVKGIRSGIFYYPAPEAVSEPQTIRYWFDRGEVVSAIPYEQAQGGTLIDTSTLASGLHILNIQVVDNRDVSTPAHSALFYIPESESADKGANVTVYIDRKEHSTYRLPEEGPLKIDLDALTLSRGLHTLSCVVKGESGNAIDATSAIFLVPAPEDTRLGSYAYWLDVDGTKVTVNPATNGAKLSLVTPVDLPALPFRSRMLDCEVSADEIRAYPVYEFHFAVFDGDKRMDHGVSEFADCRISKNALLAGIGILQEAEEKNETVANPGQNEIAWYRFNAGEETVFKFRTDRECVVELFGPDGELVCRKAGTDATSDTTMTFEVTGPHYLAVHDFEPQTVTLTYTLRNPAPTEDSAIDNIAVDAESITGECYDLRGIPVNPEECRGRVVIWNNRKVIVR